MINLPKFSIITPSYNQAQFIETTIKSVLSQEYPNLEYIIIDGGSTDGTVEIFKKYKTKIIFKSEKDRGQVHALNKGIKMATGDIISYLNSDDIYLPGTLSRISDFFQKNSKTMWVTGKCRIIDNNGCEIRSLVSIWKNLWLNINYKDALFILNYISQPSTFWRKTAMEKTGLFDEKQKLSMDYDYWLRLNKFYRTGIINDYLSAFRIHDNSKSKNYFIKQFQEGYDIMKRYTNSPVFRLLHKLHDYFSINSYKMLNT